jgi:hypothetical protein
LQFSCGSTAQSRFGNLDAESARPRVVCDSSAHDHSTCSNADVSIPKYREQVPRNHPCIICILRIHQRIPVVFAFRDFDAFQARRFLHLRSPRTRSVRLESRTKSQILSIANERSERDLSIPGNITVYLDLSVRQQSPKCDLFINAIRYTALYARPRFPVSIDIERITTSKRPIFDHPFCHTKLQRASKKSLILPYLIFNLHII